MCVVFVDDYKSHVLQFTKDLDVDHHLIGFYFDVLYYIFII